MTEKRLFAAGMICVLAACVGHLSGQAATQTNGERVLRAELALAKAQIKKLKAENARLKAEVKKLRAELDLPTADDASTTRPTTRPPDEPKEPVTPNPPAKDNQADAKVRQKLGEKIRAEFDEVELGDVVEFLGSTAGVDIEVKWDVLADAGVTQQSIVRIDAKQVPLETAIKMILKSVKPSKPVGFKVREGKVVISTQKDLAGMGKRMP